MAQENKQKKQYTSSKFVLLQDLSLSVVASLLSILMIRGLSEPIPGFASQVWLWIGVALAGSLLGELVSRIWKQMARFLDIQTLGKLSVCVLLKEVVLIIVLLANGVHLPTLELKILLIAADILFSGVLLLAPRFLFTTMRMEENAVNASITRKTALVMGTSVSSIAKANAAEASGDYQVVGFLTTNRDKEGMTIGNRIVYYCDSTQDLHDLQWRLGGIDCILFPMDWNHHKDQEKNGGKDSPSGNIPVDTNHMSMVQHAFKRVFDIGLSGALLLVFSPLFGICALAIYLEDGKPVIYRQERIGKFGKPFDILKFRSMRTDAEQDHGPQLYSGEDDPRLTKVGKFLRQHHLDELPQLWNVFVGDMSFIGYRPERKFFIDQIMARNPRYKYLYQIRPGVTSYATLYNGYTDTLEKMLTRLDLDLYYLRNHSILFDVKVLGLTFLKIVSGRKF